MAETQPYESSALRTVTGPAIRPGGLDLSEQAARYCRLTAADRVLDVGCGTGATLGFLKHHFQAKPVGLDLSPLLLENARRAKPALPLIRGNAMALPFKARQFSALFCECVLSLLPDPARALSDFYRILRPAGHMVITDLYQQKVGPAQMAMPPGARGCLKGAVSRHLLAQRVTAAGFTLLLWEDHSHLLKILAAQLVFAGISLKEFWGVNCRNSVDFKARPPGYFLLVAVKGEPAHG